ncbi:MAG: hypothetical protein OXF43_09880 [Gammaproteobacteria bacterium]|nr:hypothetical protein [Gammaproteobacteria bacterium]
MAEIFPRNVAFPLKLTIFMFRGGLARHRPPALHGQPQEQIMQQAFDSLDAYRRLEESGMPEPQAGATVEVVKDAMQDLVTKQFFTTELDRRFGASDSRLDTMDSRLDTMDGRLDAMNSRLDAMDRRFDAMDGRLDAMDRRFDAMDGRFTEMDEKFTELKIDTTRDFASLRVEVANSHKLLMATMLGTALAMIAVQLAILTILLGPPADRDGQDQEPATPPALHQPDTIQ